MTDGWCLLIFTDLKVRQLTASRFHIPSLILQSTNQPANVLLHSPGPCPRIQIADFGWASYSLRPSTPHPRCAVMTSYLPPEAILAIDNNYPCYAGNPADCWSVGVILYVMLSCVGLFCYRLCLGWLTLMSVENIPSTTQATQRSEAKNQLAICS